MAGAKQEIELKFRVADQHDLRRRLAEAGAHFDGRFHEENYFCDDPSGSLKASHRILRLRRSREISDRTAGGEAGEALEYRLTYKEPVPDPQFKVRNEFEIVLSDLETMRQVLERLGFRCRFGYAKERELWRLEGVMITLDTLSFGQFVELEGTPETIGALAARLGFDLAQGITKSYLTLVAEAGPSGD